MQDRYSGQCWSISFRVCFLEPCHKCRIFKPAIRGIAAICESMYFVWVHLHAQNSGSNQYELILETGTSTNNMVPAGARFRNQNLVPDSGTRVWHLVQESVPGSGTPFWCQVLN